MTDHESHGETDTPPCPDCAAATEPFTAEGEAIWRCATCGRRTYGNRHGEGDENLPTYEEDGVAYHGTGELDLEATDALHIDDDDGEDLVED